MKSLLLLIFFSLISYSEFLKADTMDFEKYFERYLDEIGVGTFAEGLVNNNQHRKVIERDNCIARLALRDDVLNLEFDFMGASELSPNKFQLDGAMMMDSAEGSTIFESSLKLKQDQRICSENEAILHTSSRLIKNTNSISIIWVQSCQSSNGVENRYRELSCDISQSELLENK